MTSAGWSDERGRSCAAPSSASWGSWCAPGGRRLASAGRRNDLLPLAEAVPVLSHGGRLDLLDLGLRPFRTSWLIVGTNADSLVRSLWFGRGADAAPVPFMGRSAAHDGLVICWTGGPGAGRREVVRVGDQVAARGCGGPRSPGRAQPFGHERGVYQRLRPASPPDPGRGRGARISPRPTLGSRHRHRSDRVPSPPCLPVVGASRWSRACSWCSAWPARRRVSPARARPTTDRTSSCSMVDDLGYIDDDRIMQRLPNIERALSHGRKALAADV